MLLSTCKKQKCSVVLWLWVLCVCFFSLFQNEIRWLSFNPHIVFHYNNITHPCFFF